MADTADAYTVVPAKAFREDGTAPMLTAVGRESRFSCNGDRVRGREWFSAPLEGSLR